MAELNRQGIPCGVLIAPLMPGINDSPEQVQEILDLCAEAGAVNIGGICLHLRGDVREVFMEWLRSYRLDLVPRYERLYAHGAYAPKAERDRLSALARPKQRLSASGRSIPRFRGAAADSTPTAAADAARPDPGGELDPVTVPDTRGEVEPGAGEPVLDTSQIGQIAEVDRRVGQSAVGRSASRQPRQPRGRGYTASNSPVSTSRSISCSISSSLSAGISPVSTARRISRSRKRRNLRISSTSTR